MFFPDRVKGYSEARRVLKPGGHFIFNVWDKITDNEFADIVTEALSDVFPRDPPRFLARTPHGYRDADQVRDDLARSGLTDIAIEPVEHMSRAPSPRAPRSPIARARRCAARSRRAAHRAWKQRRKRQQRRLRAASAMAQSRDAFAR